MSAIASLPSSAAAITVSPTFLHQLYGCVIRSPWSLINVPRFEGHDWAVEFVEGEPATFAAAASHIPLRHKGKWYQAAALPDGSSFFRWQRLFEFIVSPDARRILVRCHRHANEEGLQAYLLTQALSFSLVEFGQEPLHATAVLTDWGAVAFMGESGFGKSTLGALMVEAGCPLVTDDMLVLTGSGDGFAAFPGPPRLKLYRHVADRIFGERYRGIQMNPTTQKLIIAMNKEQAVTEPVVLRAVYVIGDPAANSSSPAPCIERITQGKAFPLVLSGTLNNWIIDSARLQRQFRFATELARAVPFRQLSYPRDHDQFAMLRDAVLADVAALDQPD